MKFLVTGGAGMIGSHLIDILMNNGHHVLVVDDLSWGTPDNLDQHMGNHNLKFMHTKFQDISPIYLSTESFDGVFHLATLKKTFNGVEITPADVMQNSVEMAIAMSHLMKNRDKPPFMVFSSTSDVYSNSDTFQEPDRLTIGPTTITRYSYAMTKMWEEQYYLNQIQDQKFNGSVARIFGCISPRSPRNWSGGHIPIFMHKALMGDDIEIHGDGTQTRSISHAADIANALYRIWEEREQTNGEILNLGSDQQVPVRAAAEMVLQVTKSKSNIIHLPAHEVFGDYPEIMRRWADTTKAKKMLGVNFDKTLRDIIIEMNEIWKSEE